MTGSTGDARTMSDSSGAQPASPPDPEKAARSEAARLAALDKRAASVGMLAMSLEEAKEVGGRAACRAPRPTSAVPAGVSYCGCVCDVALASHARAGARSGVQGRGFSSGRDQGRQAQAGPGAPARACGRAARATHAALQTRGG